MVDPGCLSMDRHQVYPDSLIAIVSALPFDYIVGEPGSVAGREMLWVCSPPIAMSFPPTEPTATNPMLQPPNSHSATMTSQCVCEF